MEDLWQDEGFGGVGAVGDSDVEDGFDDPDELDDESEDEGEA